MSFLLVISKVEPQLSKPACLSAIVKTIIIQEIKVVYYYNRLLVYDDFII